MHSKHIDYLKKTKKATRLRVTNLLPNVNLDMDLSTKNTKIVTAVLARAVLLTYLPWMNMGDAMNHGRLVCQGCNWRFIDILGGARMTKERSSVRIAKPPMFLTLWLLVINMGTSGGSEVMQKEDGLYSQTQLLSACQAQPWGQNPGQEVKMHNSKGSSSCDHS